MAISITDLEDKFQTVTVAPYGECLVIPGVEFNPDWEAELGDQGYRCHFTDYEGKAVTLVPLKRTVPKNKVVYVPPKTGSVHNVDAVHTDQPKQELTETKQKYALKGEVWTETDEARLLKRLSEVQAPTVMAKLRMIQPEFPGRSLNGLMQKLKKLQNKEKRTAKDRRHSNHGGYHRADKWQPPEDDFLIEVWNRQPPLTTAKVAAEFHIKFPDRSVSAVSNRITDLQNEGKIQRRNEKTQTQNDTFLNKELKTLRQGVDALNKQYTELKAELENQKKFDIDHIYVPLNMMTDDVEELKKSLSKHKHAVSGDAMIPMETS
jgi:hypothetical protein